MSEAAAAPDVVGNSPSAADTESHAAVDAGHWKPRFNPWLVAFSVMAATFMEVLDTSVAAVVLPNIAGSLSSTPSEATWVLTSYLVANAIVLPAAGWFGSFFGRKRFYLACVAIFTLSSLACGAAHSLGFLILARVFQGLGGGALQPISQAVLLESFPPRQRGQAMAFWALGVVVAPIIGPPLGGWLTDHYAWCWVFYINIPVGIAALILGQLFIEDPPYVKNSTPGSIDYIGFGLLTIWLAALQIFLDKGQEEDWFASHMITVLAIASTVAMVAFILWELREKNPIVSLKVLHDRNFSTGIFLIFVVGAVLYATTTLLPQFLQGLMGYPAMQSGLAVTPRGMGSMASMFMMAAIIMIVDARLLVFVGFAMLAWSMFALGGINLAIDTRSIILANVISGLAIGFIFVPITTLSTATLPQKDIGNATGIFNLMRNIGGSVGISLTTMMVARGSQGHQALMVGHMTPYDPAYTNLLQTLQHGLVAPLGQSAHQAAVHLSYGLLVQQATLQSFVDSFNWLGWVSIACLPLVFLFRRVHGGAGATSMH